MYQLTGSPSQRPPGAILVSTHPELPTPSPLLFPGLITICSNLVYLLPLQPVLRHVGS